MHKRNTSAETPQERTKEAQQFKHLGKTHPNTMILKPLPTENPRHPCVKYRLHFSRERA